VAYGNPSLAIPLRDVLSVVDLSKIPKGELDGERTLIDLESVESRQGFVHDDVPLVDVIGSTKVSFAGCELAISKLEPYLGKIILEPDPNAIGSTEWVGLVRKSESMPLTLVAYLLMLPQLCEAYRRLQAGKRHARFDPAEFLDLRVEMPRAEQIPQLLDRVLAGRQSIIHLREQINQQRSEIDRSFGG
jgi:type I restriction enzyme M protein